MKSVSQDKRMIDFEWNRQVTVINSKLCPIEKKINDLETRALDLRACSTATQPSKLQAIIS
jgi:hypothetical protein